MVLKFITKGQRIKILLFAIILIMNLSASAYTKDSKNACDNRDSAGCYNLGHTSVDVVYKSCKARDWKAIQALNEGVHVKW